MTRPHAFVGPFIGAIGSKDAINLCAVACITEYPDDLTLAFRMILEDGLYVRFKDPADYNLAVSILRNEGVLLSTIKIEP